MEKARKNKKIPILKLDDFMKTEDKVSIPMNKYKTLIEEIGYLKGAKKELVEETITIKLEEYKELLITKGKYHELKEKQLITINEKGINIPNIPTPHIPIIN